MAHAQAVGFDTVLVRGREAAQDLPAALVYAGESLGVLPAPQLAQTRPGARGALLLSGCVTPEDLGAPWPPEVPVQVHGMAGDPLFADEGDLDGARALVAGPRTPSCSSTTGPGTCSPSAAAPTMSPGPPSCSCSGCWPSWTAWAEGRGLCEAAQGGAGRGRRGRQPTSTHTA